MKNPIATAVLSAFVLAGCFSERAPITGNGNAGDLCDGAPAAGVVQVRNFAFDPATITLSAGETVTWVNCDSESHTATENGFAWDSGLIGPDASFERTFGSAGTFDYHCEPHPFMTGRVVVQ